MQLFDLMRRYCIVTNANIKRLLAAQGESHKIIFPGFLCKNIFNAFLNDRQSLKRRNRLRKECTVIVPVHQLYDAIQEIFENNQRGINAIYRCNVAVVEFHGSQDCAFEPNIVDDETFLLAFEHTVYTGNRLDQIVGLNRLVQIHSVHRRDIESGDPHIDNDCNFQV